MSTKDRNDTVDTIRAVLVFSVMLYHFTVRWKGENLYNFDGSFSSRLHYGSLGVDLFFIISGFFVVHTLTSAGTAFVFIKKRVLRIVSCADRGGSYYVGHNCFDRATAVYEVTRGLLLLHLLGLAEISLFKRR